MLEGNRSNKCACSDLQLPVTYQERKFHLHVRALGLSDGSQRFCGIGLRHANLLELWDPLGQWKNFAAGNSHPCVFRDTVQYSSSVQDSLSPRNSFPLSFLLPRRSLFSNPCLLFASLPSRFRDELAKDGTPPPHGPGSGRGNTAVGAGTHLLPSPFRWLAQRCPLFPWRAVPRPWRRSGDFGPVQPWRIWIHSLCLRIHASYSWIHCPRWYGRRPWPGPSWRALATRCTSCRRWPRSCGPACLTSPLPHSSSLLVYRWGFLHHLNAHRILR
jgi:hypothetical protein